MSCPPGKIRRSSYVRKAHSRKSYSRGSKRVPASYVSRTRVPSSCVPDKGAPGKTPSRKRVLPKLGREISLSIYGYETDKSATARHAALKKASDKHDPLKILRRLVLLSNYQADPTAKKVMKDDVEFMKKVYQQYKVSSGMVGRGSKKSSRKTSRKASKRGSRK
jgi:hypothetical protein